MKYFAAIRSLQTISYEYLGRKIYQTSMTKLPNKTKLIPHEFCKFCRQFFATESYLLIINSPTAEETLPDIRWVDVDHLSFVNFFCRFDTFFISLDSHLNLMLTRAVLVSLPEWAVQWSFIIFKPVLCRRIPEQFMLRLALTEIHWQGQWNS